LGIAAAARRIRQALIYGTQMNTDYTDTSTMPNTTCKTKSVFIRVNPCPFLGARRILLLALFVGFVAHRGYYSRKLPPSAENTVVEQEGGFAQKVGNVLSSLGLLAVAVYVINPTWMSWASFIGGTWIAATTLNIFSRIQFEEEAMLSRFGDQYSAYMRTTGRLLPRI
jgi:hypothetical protein